MKRVGYCLNLSLRKSLILHFDKFRSAEKGNLLFMTAFNGKTFDISTKDLPNGLCLLRITDEKGYFVKDQKIMILHDD